jgi:hypothetical protein
MKSKKLVDTNLTHEEVDDMMAVELTTAGKANSDAVNKLEGTDKVQNKDEIMKKEREVLRPKFRSPQIEKQVKGDVLLDEDGIPLVRRLGKSDNELRRKMTTSVKEPLTEAKEAIGHPTVNNVMKDEECGWIEVNLGTTYESDDTVFNLYAAVPGQLSLGTVMKLGGGGYMIDKNGNKFDMKQEGVQLRFMGRIYDCNGSFEEVEFVHDSACAANIIKTSNATKWTALRDRSAVFGGYNGGKSDRLKGGRDLIIKLKRRQPTSCGDDDGNNDRNVNHSEELNWAMVVEEVSLAETEVQRENITMNQEDVNDEDDDKDEKETLIDEVMDLLNDMPTKLKEEYMSKLKSSSVLVNAMKDEIMKVKSNGKFKSLSDEMGTQKRLKEMELNAKKFPHLSTASLNRMVREGNISGGIEIEEKIVMDIENKLIGRATKSKVHKKRSKTKEEDAGLGRRAPFFVTMGDLIDLSNLTEGNRWGYNWLLVLMCKEYGTVKVYPLKSKADVKPAWIQFQQWIEIITPYVEAKLGMTPKVVIFANDRGAEFMTTKGQTRGELDQLLFEAGIGRWSPSTGDSNKLGKVERFNRLIIETINVMLRSVGVKNIWTYDAATFFERHYNSTPTLANKVGRGEAPFTTLGIPIDESKLVTFFCAAYVKLPKHMKVKLGEKSTLGYIIGYGTGMTMGGDTDGYKVVLEDGTIYTTAHVVPLPDKMVNGSHYSTSPIIGQEKHEKMSKIFDNEAVEGFKVKEKGVREVKDPEVNNKKKRVKSKGSRSMHIGTGVTGQMRAEMDAPSHRKNRNDVMTRTEARNLIFKARRLKWLLVWKTPNEAGKTKDSRIRYDKYWKTKTFKEFDLLAKRKQDARKDDLYFDAQKGHLSFEPDPDELAVVDEQEVDPQEEQDREDFQYINSMTMTSVESEISVVDGKVQLLIRELKDEEVLVIGATAELTDSDWNDCWEGDFLNEATIMGEALLGKSEVSVGFICAVFKNAQVWVDDRKKPMSVKEAMTLKEWPEWRAAIVKEVKGLIDAGVWEEVHRSELNSSTKVLPGKTILDIKTIDGKFEKCKARYVSRGDLSNRGEHYWDSSSHQARSKSFRMFFALSAQAYGETGKTSYLPRNLDISQAYLQSKREEGEPEIYMELPEYTFGLCRDKYSGYVAKMLRHIYGEVDGGRAFEQTLVKFIESIGGVPLVSDRMVFIWKWKGDSLKALAHVDDILYNGDSDEILDEFYRLAEKYFSKLTGGNTAENILGIKVEWDLENASVKLSQGAHVEKFLEQFGFDLQSTKSKPTPMPVDMEVLTNEGRRIGVDEWDYFKWCGFANWLATNTRPDLALVTNLCGRHAQNPGDDHVAIQKHALRYLAGTWDEGITYHGRAKVLEEPYDHKNKLITYVDSNHGVGHDTMCVVVMLNGGAVITRVLKQRVITTSTAHSEMLALAAGVKELQWAVDFMAEMGHEQGTIRLLGDNQSANLQATGDYKSSKSDHYRKIQFYVEDNIRQGLVWIDKVATEDNISDIGTKQVKPVAQFNHLKNIVMGNTPILVETKLVKDIKEGKYDDFNHA